MRVALFGCSGQLGNQLQAQLKEINWDIVSVGRRNSSIYTDLRNPKSLLGVLKSLEADIIINAAAITDISYCDRATDEPWIVNCLSSNILSDYCYNARIKYVYISTDQVYEHKENSSSENDPVFLKNIYAKTKYWGEPRLNPNSLTVRTSFFGLRSQGRDGFVNYLVNSINKGEKVNLYQNIFTSALADDLCANLIIRLLQDDAVGIFNVGTRCCYSKAEFGFQIIQELGKVEVSYEIIDKPESEVKVNGNVGMNCSKVEGYLGTPMPQMSDVVASVIDKIGK